MAVLAWHGARVVYGTVWTAMWPSLVLAPVWAMLIAAALRRRRG